MKRKIAQSYICQELLILRDIMKLEPLNKEILKESIKECYRTGNLSVSITLIHGDLLFGDVHNMPTGFQGTQEEAAKEELWLPEKYKDEPPMMKFYYQLLPIRFMFNSKDGSVYGKAKMIEIPSELISGIKKLPWSEQSTSSRLIKNIPNPIATKICEHNTRIARKHGLEIREYMENALSKSAIPPEGIKFKGDNEIIYADWNYFSRLSKGVVNVGFSSFVTINYRKEKSLTELIYDKIDSNAVKSIKKFLVGGDDDSEQQISGFIQAPNQKENTTTKMEGVECKVILCSDEKGLAQSSNITPVILKEDSIQYPPEMLSEINSKLIFFGESKQIPIGLKEVQSDQALLARAVAYVETKQ